MTDLRSQIGQGILNVCAGTETEITILAQADALATAIGGISHLNGAEFAEAVNLADEVAAMIKAHIQCNWGRICYAPHSSDLYHAGGTH